MAIVVNMGALDRPVWSALTTGDRRFAEGGSLALRFPPDIAPFGATAAASAPISGSPTGVVLSRRSFGLNAPSIEGMA